MRLIGFLWSVVYLLLFFFILSVFFSVGTLWQTMDGVLITVLSLCAATYLPDHKNRLNRQWIMSLHDGVVELHHSPVCLLYRMDKESFIESLKDAIDKARTRVPGFPIVFKTATVHGIVRELGFVEVKESDTPLTWFSAFWLTMLNVYNLPRLPVLFVKLFRGRAIEYRLPFNERVGYLQEDGFGIYSNPEDEGKEEGCQQLKI